MLIDVRDAEVRSSINSHKKKTPLVNPVYDQQEEEELNRQILEKIGNHLTKPKHPIARYLDVFKKAFLS